MARVLGRMLYALGIISSGHCVERAAGDLIGSYVGQTKDKASSRGPNTDCYISTGKYLIHPL